MPTATLTALHMRLSGQSILASVLPQNLQNGTDPAHVPGPQRRAEPKRAFGYTIPNLLIDHSMRNPHVPPGFWRGVNINQNAIYLECFMDELAQCGRPGPARIPAQADGEASQAPRACSTRWPKRSAGASRRRRASIAGSRR